MIEMSDEAQGFLEALRQYSALMSAPAGALFGYMAGRRKNNAEAKKIEADADAITLDAVTRNFQALIEGYEKRVADITREVEDLREEVKELRKELDKRPRPALDSKPWGAAIYS